MASATPTEIELKLLLPPHARETLERCEAMQPPQASPADVREERTTYFDTPSFDLAKCGISLRVRRSGHRRIQTVKTAADGRGLAAVRGEWEWPIEADAPDLTRLAEVPLGTEILAAAASGLEPVYATEIRRTARTLTLPGGTSAEAVFDHGRVVAAERSQPIDELELELIAGAPGPLYRLALALHQLAPFTIGAESKAQRGHALRTGSRPQAVEPEPPTLGRDCSALEAVRALLGTELAGLIANQPATEAGEVEGVHQSRTGIRRLRTVLALFGEHLEPHATARFEAELKRLGQVFGGARDWDVFCTEMLADAERDDRAGSWTALLREPAEAERRAAHAAVVAELHAPAMTAALLGMAAWAEPDETGAVAMDAGTLGRKLRKLAPDLLDRMARRVSKRGSHLQERSAEELHALRKSLKKLRYSADYLAGLYRPSQVKSYRAAAKHVLKLLGAGNDATVAVALGERLAARRPELVPAAGALAAWGERRRERAYRALPKAWAELTDAVPFWR